MQYSEKVPSLSIPFRFWYRQTLRVCLNSGPEGGRSGLRDDIYHLTPPTSNMNVNVSDVMLFSSHFSVMFATLYMWQCRLGSTFYWQPSVYVWNNYYSHGVSFLPSCQIFSSHAGTHAPILFCQSKSGANITEKWLKKSMTSLTFTFILDVGGVKWCMSGFQSHGGNVRRQLQLGAVERWCHTILEWFLSLLAVTIGNCMTDRCVWPAECFSCNG